MIYEYPDKTKPIKQGDIFYPLPLPVLDLESLRILDKDKIADTNWVQVIKDREKTEIVTNVPVELTWGIVASQNCDAVHSPFVTFFEIGTLEKISGMPLPKNSNKWVSFITTKSRLMARWFYLPTDENIGFNNRMAVNFQKVYMIQRENLEQYVENLRKGRLNEIAYLHYRESISHYFRRYPYEEWYPLTKDEFKDYNKIKGPVDSFEWQK